MPGAGKAADREKHHSVRKLAKFCVLSPHTNRRLFVFSPDVLNLPSVCVIESSAAARPFEFLEVLASASSKPQQSILSVTTLL